MLYEIQGHGPQFPVIVGASVRAVAMNCRMHQADGCDGTIPGNIKMRGIIQILLITIFLSAFDSVLCNNTTKKPTVLVGILVRNKAHTLPYFLTLLERLDYPKERMTLCIRSDNNIDNTVEILELWLNAESHKYHAVDVIIDEKSTGPEDETSIADWPMSRFLRVINLREGILNNGRKIWADYVFMLDADVFLTNPASLNLLISKNKTVVAPLVKSDGMYSNFWAGMGPDYYYVRTDRYEPIFNREEIGCHQVPMIHSVILIDMRKYESDLLTYNFENVKNYYGPKDDIITFALSANISGVSLYVCNDHIYGYVMVPLVSHDSLTTDMQQLTNLKLEILAQQRYLEVSDDMKKFVRYPAKNTLGFDKIYMINLRRRPERRVRMERCFQELGILAETIDAVDGRVTDIVQRKMPHDVFLHFASRSLNETSLQKWGVKMIPDYIDPYHKRPMTMGEIGCFLSHYLVWKKILDNDYKRVMILEDDIRFEPFFRHKMAFITQELERLQLEWDLIYLGRKRMHDQEEPLVNGSKLLVHASYSYWTLGYIVSQSGVGKLLKAKPLDNMIPVDEYLPILFDRHPRLAWKEYFPQRDLVAFSVTPLVVYPTHYTGESGYVSDTEDSKIIAIDKIMLHLAAKQEL